MFITFDGVDGSGKSTLRNKVAYELGEQYDIDDKILYQKEPGITPVGEVMRKVLLDKDDAYSVTPKAELFMYAADRAAHYEQMLKPDLKNGYIVMCDRYFESTYVYQHLIRGVIDREEFRVIHRIATDNLMPDIGFIIHSEYPHSLKGDRMDQQMAGYRARIIDLYKSIRHDPYFDYDIYCIDTTEGNWQEYVDFMVDKIGEKLQKEAA
jgi:dTMP kinase